MLATWNIPDPERFTKLWVYKTPDNLTASSSIASYHRLHPADPVCTSVKYTDTRESQTFRNTGCYPV